MLTLSNVFLLLAAICFAISAANRTAGSVNLQSLGLLLLTIAFLVG
jgi:hypothetical protein